MPVEVVDDAASGSDPAAPRAGWGAFDSSGLLNRATDTFVVGGENGLLYALALLPVSIGPTVVGLAGRGYFWIALVLSLALVALSAQFAASRTEQTARRLFYGSIIYLPLVWAALVLGH